MDQKLNFAFFGTPEVASKTLEILKQEDFIPALIITAPDRPKGRGMQLQQSPVAEFAKQNNISYFKPEKLNNELAKKLSAKSYELAIVVAYGKIMPENILNIPKLGSINVHYSLLPKYRGASPVESAILNGETKTGVTIQKMVYQMDAGPILAQTKTEIFPNETASELRARLIKLGGDMLVKILKTPSSFPLSGGKQQDESQATYCKKIKKEDGLLDLNDNPVKNYNKFRAYAHWPRIFYFKNGKRIIVTQAKLANDPLDSARGKQFVIEKILPEGKKEQDYQNSIYTLA